jgi:NhaA family Na+:H+ antiporter
MIILLLLLGLNRLGIRSPLPYGLLGIGLWLAFLRSGIHPTIAGVLLALTIPARSGVMREAFQAQCISVLSGFEGSSLEEDEPGVTSGRQQAAAQTLETIAERIQNPAQRLERTFSPWVAYLILPIFALANAGVALGEETTFSLSSPLTLGIIFGQVVGKSVGITLFSWIAVKLRIAELPQRITWPQLLSSTFLAGIGFTMALFIAGTAFTDAGILSSAKLSILLGSVVSGVIGFLGLYVTTSVRTSFSTLSTAEASS